MAVNLHGVLYGTLAAYRVMVRQGHGHIVNVSSLSGLISQPGNGPYCTAKHALVGLSLSLRFEGADLGVKVSCVCPGDMKTDIYKNMTVVNMKVDTEEIVRVSRSSHFLMPQWSAEQRGAGDPRRRGPEQSPHRVSRCGARDLAPESTLPGRAVPGERPAHEDVSPHPSRHLICAFLANK